MTASGESQRETTGVKLEVMSAQTKTRIGFWNVRSKYETGKLAQVTAEMRRYNLHVLGVSGERPVEFCTKNNLVIGGALFPQREMITDDVRRDGIIFWARR